MRVCQFRHDGNWTYITAAAARPPCQEDLHFYSTDANRCVKLLIRHGINRTRQIFLYNRSCNNTVTVSPSSLPIAFRMSPRTGNLWVPSPIAMKELLNE
jgi:hypothetical protein